MFDSIHLKQSSKIRFIFYHLPPHSYLCFMWLFIWTETQTCSATRTPVRMALCLTATFDKMQYAAWQDTAWDDWKLFFKRCPHILVKFLSWLSSWLTITSYMSMFGLDLAARSKQAQRLLSPWFDQRQLWHWSSMFAAYILPWEPTDLYVTWLEDKVWNQLKPIPIIFYLQR